MVSILSSKQLRTIADSNELLIGLYTKSAQWKTGLSVCLCLLTLLLLKTTHHFYFTFHFPSYTT